ncbi:MAG TPA: hypothetical protein VGJ27_01185 [Gaiellaceae bacterium]|jgi:hypothetical protein
MKRTLAIAMLVAAAWVSTGSADGGGASPGLSFDGNGIQSRRGDVRYVTVFAGRGSVVEAVRVRGGLVLRSRFLGGMFGIPFVTYDGSVGGLSHDGRRLVLASIPPNLNRPVTRFVVLDPRTFRIKTQLSLRGNFAFDALSPGGSLMYLIQHLGAPNSGRYAVRAMNLNTRRLYSGAIVDRREPDEKMTGIPVTRVESGDGNWAYTLYSRTNKSPFVHALDTGHRRAFCIDLPFRPSTRWIGSARMRMSSDGRQLILFTGRKVRATVDTKSFEVSSA